MPELKPTIDHLIKAASNALYGWEPNTRRYRNNRTGQFISREQMIELRANYLEQEKAINVKLTRRLLGREITLSEWEEEMRANLRRTYTIQYMLGRGGRGQMGQRDFGILGSLLKKQYKFLANFAEEIANGRYNVNQVASVATRQQLYAMSSNQAYERAKAEAWGLVDLPAIPGDGSSECMSNDRCTWEFEEIEKEILAYWRLSVAEHCPTCLDRSRKWAPLRFPKR